MLRRTPRPLAHLAVVATVVALTAAAGCAATGPDPAADDVSEAAAASQVAATPPPPPPAGATSFAYSVPRQVPSESSATTEVTGCPEGYYVRPGTGDTEGANTPAPMIHLFVGDTVWMHQTQTPALLTEYPGTALYQQVKAGYDNLSPDSTHHFTMTFWCDKLPSAPLTSAVDPAATGASALTGTRGHFAVPMRSSHTGLYLTDAHAGSAPTMSASPTTLYFGGDQNGSLVEVDETYAYGVWTLDGALVGSSLAIVNGTPQWVATGDGLGNGGQLLPVQGAMTDGSTLLVQSASVPIPADPPPNGPGVLGAGGQCLAAPDGAGSTPALADCDATDPSQYWFLG